LHKTGCAQFIACIFLHSLGLLHDAKPYTAPIVPDDKVKVLA